MKQAHCIYQEDDHRWLAIARDATKPGYIIDTNEYVVVNGDEALLCDPGGIEIFPAVFSALSAECDPTMATTVIFLYRRRLLPRSKRLPTIFWR